MLSIILKIVYTVTTPMVFDVRFRIVKKEEENGDQEDDETQRERETESKFNGNDSTGNLMKIKILETMHMTGH